METSSKSNINQSEKTSDNSQTVVEPHHEAFASGRSFYLWLMVGIFGFALLVLALSAHHLFSTNLQAGEKADRDLIANHAQLVVDETATRKARQAVRQNVVPVYRKLKDEDTRTINGVQTLLNEIDQIQNAGLVPVVSKVPLNAKEHLALLQSSLEQFVERSKQTGAIAELKEQRQAITNYRIAHAEVKDTLYLIALSVPHQDFPQYKNTVESATSRICHSLRRMPEEDDNWKEITSEFVPDTWNQSLKEYTTDLICSQLRTNMEVDLDATETRSAALSSQIKPVMKEITVGQVIVPKGNAITAENIEVLQQMGIDQVNRFHFIMILTLSLAAAVLLVALALYTLAPKHLFSTASIGLMYSMAIIVFAAAAFLGKSYPALIPLPAAALILTIFLGQQPAAAVTLSAAVLLGFDGLIDLSDLIALSTASGAAIGFYSRKRHALISTAVIMALTQGAGYLAAAAAQGTFSGSVLAKGTSFEFFGGFILAVIAIGSLPFLENLTGMLTPFRLAELTDADQPLLRKLEENAPGTYQHSLAVANLAEAGARAINGDVNLVRAGAFYHDVGKMVRPRYFIENQLGDKNPHDAMSPEDSRERVLAHVTDGIALAKEYKLPQAVQDFIPMHQGTSLMAYFYHKACLRDGVENVDPLFYRYPGPKPQSKETSIVMLADVSEAVTHSMRDPSQAEVEEAMDKVFQNRWDDGQFSESSLSAVELEKIKKAFVHVWRTLHHERLKYPSTTTGKMAVPPSVVSKNDQAEPPVDDCGC